MIGMITRVSFESGITGLPGFLSSVTLVKGVVAIELLGEMFAISMTFETLNVVLSLTFSEAIQIAVRMQLNDKFTRGVVAPRSNI